MTLDRRPWSPKSDYPVLKRMAAEGHGATEIAAVLDRSERAVRCKASELGLSLRTKGVRRGLVLGQPRGVSLTADPRYVRLRDLIMAGRIDMAVVLTRMALRLDVNAELCPHCASRPVAPNSRFGLCAVCHKRELIEALNDELQLLEARREQATAWQRIHRAKEAIEQGGEA